MSFGEKLYELRKKLGLSQEQVAERLGVSRQTISKWETNQSTPDLDKLKPLAELYGASLDALLGNEPIQKEPILTRTIYQYEYISKTKIGSLPLVHVHLGMGMQRAKGVIAIGNIATGLISLGIVSIGLLSLGAVGLGFLAICGVACGLIALGGCALGVLAIGGVAVGLFALGGFAFGQYAIGGVSVASDIALGGYATGHVAIGESAHGARAFVTHDGFAGIDPEQLRMILKEEFPHIWNGIIDLFCSIVKS